MLVVFVYGLIGLCGCCIWLMDDEMFVLCGCFFLVWWWCDVCDWLLGCYGVGGIRLLCCCLLCVFVVGIVLLIV